MTAHIGDWRRDRYRGWLFLLEMALAIFQSGWLSQRFLERKKKKISAFSWPFIAKRNLSFRKCAAGGFPLLGPALTVRATVGKRWGLYGGHPTRCRRTLAPAAWTLSVRTPSPRKLSTTEQLVPHSAQVVNTIMKALLRDFGGEWTNDCSWRRSKV